MLSRIYTYLLVVIENLTKTIVDKHNQSIYFKLYLQGIYNHEKENTAYFKSDFFGKQFQFHGEMSC